MLLAGTDIRSQGSFAEGWLVVPSPGTGWAAKNLSALRNAGAAGTRPLSSCQSGRQVPALGSRLASVMILHGGGDSPAFGYQQDGQLTEQPRLAVTSLVDSPLTAQSVIDFSCAGPHIPLCLGRGFAKRRRFQNFKI